MDKTEALRRILEISYRGHPEGRETRLEMIERYAKAALEEPKNLGYTFRYRYTKRGGHYHIRMFSAMSPEHTFAKLGELVLDEKDFEKLCKLDGLQPSGVNIEIVEE